MQTWVLARPGVNPTPSPYMLLLLLLLSCFSRVRLCATSQMAAHQAPPSLGFSRQEYWSGLPFPSPMHACMLSRFSRVRRCATPWTAAHQAPLSTGFSRQEYWSGLPCPPPGDHPKPGIKLRSPTMHVHSLQSEPPGKPLINAPGTPLQFSCIKSFNPPNNPLRWVLSVFPLYKSGS